jgi:biotin operon repressor
MPIPTSNPDAAPRRLLREVVFEKMLAAIVDGTLEPGERLNDDQLVKWLGVSRTPVREAIAQLQTYGLVEIEANRFTRVAARDDIVYAEAAQFLAGLHTLAQEWGSGSLDAARRESLRERPFCRNRGTATNPRQFPPPSGSRLVRLGCPPSRDRRTGGSSQELGKASIWPLRHRSKLMGQPVLPAGTRVLSRADQLKGLAGDLSRSER